MSSSSSSSYSKKSSYSKSSQHKRKRLNSEEKVSDSEYEDDSKKNKSQLKRFQARTKCAGTLLRALDAINNDQKAQIVGVTVDSSELRFDVDDLGKCLQASAVIPKLAFEEFKYACWNEGDFLFYVFLISHHSVHLPRLHRYHGKDRLSVRLSLHLLIQCMSVFGSSNAENTNIMIFFDSDSDVLSMTLDVDGVVTECELAILVTDDVFLHSSYVQDFRTKRVINQTIIRSERLREAFSELSDCPGASAICLTMSPREPQFRMEARGSLFSLTIDLASSMMQTARSSSTNSKSDDTFIDFKSLESQICKYRVKYLKHAFRALGVARETMIQINEVGMLLVDHMLLDEGRATKIYVHCALYPLEDLEGDSKNGDDDDEEEEEEEEEETEEED